MIPETKLKKVVLPAPFGPIRLTICPLPILKESLLNATKPSKCLEMEFICKIGSLKFYQPIEVVLDTLTYFC